MGIKGKCSSMLQVTGSKSLKSVRFSKSFPEKFAKTRGFLWCSVIVGLQNFCTCKSSSMHAMNDISLISIYHEEFNLKIYGSARKDSEK